MRNPFSDRKFAIIYAIVWGVIMTFQILVSIFYLEQDSLSAVLQAVVQNSSLAILGGGIWFVVKYSMTMERQLRSLFSITFSGLFLVILWMGFTFIIENLLFRASNGVIEFQRHHLYQFVVGCFLFSIFALSYRMMILFHNYNQKTKSEEKLKNMLAETKLNALKAYVNPHFLFNSLNSVNALIPTDPEKARDMIVNLSEYFRYSLKQKDISFIPFEEELHYTLTYFGIEKLRFGDRIIADIDVDEDVKDIQFPVMLLQPLFENVIKHAVSESLLTIKMEFSAKLKDQKLVIRLSNNFDPESIPRKGNGIGISTTAERLHLIYGDRNLLKYSKKDGIFSVLIEIPT